MFILLLGEQYNLDKQNPVSGCLLIKLLLPFLDMMVKCFLSHTTGTNPTISIEPWLYLKIQ
jgi:hypothetical protein